MARFQPLAEDLRAAILDLHAQGLTQAKIAAQVGVSPNTVWKVIKRHRNEGGGSSTPAPAPATKKKPAPKASGRKDVSALATLAWTTASLPIGAYSPSAGILMRHQGTQAGRDIDTLLRGTAFYEALAGGAKSEKVMAAFNLGAPLCLGVVADSLVRMQARDPENPRIGAMLTWLESMLVQVLAMQGLQMPSAPAPPPRPAAAPPTPPAATPPQAPPPPAPPADTNGKGDVQDVASKAATASRFDHVE